MAAGLSVVVVSAAGVVGANAFPDQQVAEVDLTTEADFLAVSPNGGTVYVTSQGGGSGALSTVDARTDGSFRTVRAKCVLKGNTLSKRLSDRLCGLVEKKSDKRAKVIAAPTCTKGLRIQVTLAAKKPGETRTTWRKTWRVKAKNPIQCKIGGTG